MDVIQELENQRETLIDARGRLEAACDLLLSVREIHARGAMLSAREGVIAAIAALDRAIAREKRTAPV